MWTGEFFIPLFCMRSPFFLEGRSFLLSLIRCCFCRVLTLYRYVDANEVTILREIGRGGFGTVFEGRYQHMRVAVKKMNRLTDQEVLKFKEELVLMRYQMTSFFFQINQEPSLSKREKIVDLYLFRMMKISSFCMHEDIFLCFLFCCSTLHHNNVVRLYGAYENPDLHIVMEFCDSNLKTYLSENASSLTEPQAYDLILKITQGMCFMHANGRSIIHRDLKPENILVCLFVYDVS